MVMLLHFVSAYNYGYRETSDESIQFDRLCGVPVLVVVVVIVIVVVPLLISLTVKRLSLCFRKHMHGKPLKSKLKVRNLSLRMTNTFLMALSLKVHRCSP